MVSAVVLSPAQVVASTQLVLVSDAVDVVQEDASGPESEEGVGEGGMGGAAARLPAHHLGVGEGPGVIAHRPPEALVVDLNPALAVILTPHQTDGAVTWNGTTTHLNSLCR